MMNKQYTDIAYIRRYVNGELSPREMFELEHVAQQDEMIMDIIIGMEFEKSHLLTDNIEEIRHKIQERISQKQPTKIFPWARWSIAASILFVIGISTYVFLSRQDQGKLDTIAYQPQEEPKGENQMIEQKKVEDNVSKNTDKADGTKKIVSNKFSADKDTIRIATDDTEQRIAAHSSELSALPKDNSRKLDLASLKPQKTVRSEEIHLMGIAGGDTITPTLEEISLSYKIPKKDSLTKVSIAAVQTLKNQHTQAKVEQKTYTESPEQLRAKLNNMNIDPQTSMVLNQVLNQQAREKTEVVGFANNKRKNMDIADHNYTYLANIKSADIHILEKKDSDLTESTQTVTFGKEMQDETSEPTASHPTNGWKALDDYLGQALSAHGIKSGHLQFKFKINSKGKPENIEVIYSDNRDINAIFIDILQKGPIWTAGKDAEKVKLEVRF